MTGLVTFRIGAREYAASLSDVLEVVRLPVLSDLPGMTPPLVGVLDLRGAALPVLDLRVGAGPADPGDVLVLDGDDSGPVGVAVDQVRAVLAEGELLPAGTGSRPGVLPAYVLDVLSGGRGVVFLVDLHRMLAAVGPVQPGVLSGGRTGATAVASGS